MTQFVDRKHFLTPLPVAWQHRAIELLASSLAVLLASFVRIPSLNKSIGHLTVARSSLEHRCAYFIQLHQFLRRKGFILITLIGPKAYSSSPK